MSLEGGRRLELFTTHIVGGDLNHNICRLSEGKEGKGGVGFLASFVIGKH